jgi:hypothetical protein
MLAADQQVHRIVAQYREKCHARADLARKSNRIKIKGVTYKESNG